MLRIRYKRAQDTPLTLKVTSPCPPNSIELNAGWSLDFVLQLKTAISGQTSRNPNHVCSLVNRIVLM